MGYFTPALRVALASILLSGFALVPACGSDDAKSKDDDRGEAGSGGSAGASGGTSSGGGAPAAIECGANVCEPQPILSEMIPACCTADETCGLDSSFLEGFGPTFDEACQPRDQPGELDPGCPSSEAVEVPDAGVPPVVFEGCCRADVGRCGYMVDRLFGVLEIGLGCVDSQPFLDGATPEACDPNAPGGSGGAAGATAREATSGAGGAG